MRLGARLATANYGTNNGSAWSRPDNVPARSDDILINSSVYSDAGDLTQKLDPAATVTLIEYDDKGRVIRTVNNYVPGGGSSSSGLDQDRNQTVLLTYNGIDEVLTSTCENPVTGNQTTTYDYGVTQSASKLNSNDLLQTKTLPGSIITTFEYNRQGQVIVQTDNAGTVHEYTFDKMGREVSDEVTAFGTDVDDFVKEIVTVYERRGMVTLKTSLGDSATVRNQVKLEYDDYRKLQKDFQALQAKWTGKHCGSSTSAPEERAGRTA
jgi:YD repeat-containing protein